MDTCLYMTHKQQGCKQSGALIVFYELDEAVLVFDEHDGILKTFGE